MDMFGRGEGKEFPGQSLPAKTFKPKVAQLHAASQIFPR